MKTLARIAWILSIIMRLFFIGVIFNLLSVLDDFYYDYGIMGVLIYLGLIIACALHFFLIFPKKINEILLSESVRNDPYFKNFFPKPSPAACAVILFIAILFACFLYFYSYSWLIKNYDISDENIPADDDYETEPELWMDMDDTVYISSTGKIHLTPDCSGMQSSDEMTYEEACEAGYSHCSRCFD